jgi:ribosomal protein S18 acetylase RimI-like enzyme
MTALPNANVLDNAAWAALTGPHAHLAQTHGQVARYPVDMSPFVGFSDDATGQAWDDLAALAGPGVVVALSGIKLEPPPDWEVVGEGSGVQLVDRSLQTAPDPEAQVLGVGDVPDMLALVTRAQPGPFGPRTIELGTYLGIRRGGELVAMAGERLHPPGWVEISAVCTDEAYRGQGLATRLVRAVAAGIRGRGETPFLHAAATNTPAIRLYLALGFELRRKTTFLAVRTPERWRIPSPEDTRRGAGTLSSVHD